jgi:hypothetical protein
VTTGPYCRGVGLWHRTVYGNGRIPEPLRTELLAEEADLLEDLPGWLVLRRYRAPRARMSGTESTAGAIALTPRRLVVCNARGELRGKHIDVPRDPVGRPRGITLRSDKPGRIVFGYDPAAFHRDRSGWVELRLVTDRTPELLRVLGPP